MSEARPYLAAAFLCEKVLIEKDKVLSAIRMVDTFFIQKPNLPPGLPPDLQPAINLTLLLSFKKAEPGPTQKHQVVLHMIAPSGKPLQIKNTPQPQDPTGSFLFEEHADRLASANLIFNLGLGITEYGLHWIDVLLDGERITRIPFSLLLAGDETLPEH